MLKNVIEEIHRHRQESENSEQLSIQIQNMEPKRGTIESVAKEIASLKSEMGALWQTLSEDSSHNKTSFADATRRSLSNQPLYVSVREARKESNRQESVAKEDEKWKAKEQNICITGLAESDDDNALVKEICDELGGFPSACWDKKDRCKTQRWGWCCLSQRSPTPDSPIRDGEE